MKAQKVVLVFLMGLLLMGCSATESETEIAPDLANEDTAIENNNDDVSVAVLVTNTPTAVSPDAVEETTIQGEVWADNWFALYGDDGLIVEDSVSITTERSFNAETFTFEAAYPFNLYFIAKDFKENDTGLEYIGTNRQQMGDGGFIAQFTDTATGVVIGVTDANVRCLVIHEAPLDKSCENESNPVAGAGSCDFTTVDEPDGWQSVEFDDSGWPLATIHSESAVSPKDGYDQIVWDAAAQLIWGPDLETNNTLLCRLTVAEPGSSE